MAKRNLSLLLALLMLFSAFSVTAYADESFALLGDVNDSHAGHSHGNAGIIVEDALVENIGASTTNYYFLDVEAPATAEAGDQIEVVFTVKNIKEELAAVEFFLDFDETKVAPAITDSDEMDVFMTKTPMYTAEFFGQTGELRAMEQLCRYNSSTSILECRFLDLLDYSGLVGEEPDMIINDGDLVITIPFVILDTASVGDKLTFSLVDGKTRGTTKANIKDVYGSGESVTVSVICNHAWSDWKTVANATCTTAGSKTRTCSKCNSTETEAISSLGHSYKSIVTAPTCTAEGYTTHTCSRCGDTYVDSTVAAKGHSWSVWTTNKQATCEEDGEQSRTCSACGEKETKVLTKLGHSYKAIVTEPTCTEEGYTTHTCLKCKDSYVDSYVDAKGHAWSEWTTDVAATCEEDGSESRTCSACSAKETNVLPKLGHDYKATVTAPTCTEKGYTTHTCATCGDSYVDSYVDAKGHAWSEWTTDVAATCEEDGLESRTCSACSAKETNVLPKLGHDYKATVTAPTCTEKGYTTHTCATCGDSYVDSYVDAKGHAWSEWTTDVAATCEEDGLESRTCSACSAKETNVLPKLGHDYKATVTAPTCTEEGYTTHTCATCGDSYVDSYVDAKGHAWSEWTTDEAATCEEDGSESRTCSACSAKETNVLPKLGHDYKATVTAPTCTEEGYTTHTCATCGDSYVDSYVDAKGHAWSEWTTDVAATCEEDGSESRTCSACSAKETNVLPKLGHDYKATVTAPTCTEEGYTTHTCATCGDSYVDSYVDAKGHAWSEWTTDVAATCEEDGSESRTCSACSAKETNVLPKLGHDYKATVTAPTCTEKGYTTHTCATCGDSYVDSYVDAKGHAWSEWTTDVAATCEEDGSESRTCSACSAKETNVLPKLGHDYKATVTAPTCTEEGYTTHTCATCGDSYVDSYVDAKGHAWSEWTTDVAATCEEDGSESRTCSACSAKETNVLPKLGHDYKVTVTAPTCTEKGYTTHTCATCGDSYVDSYVDAKGHAWSEWTTDVAATCEEDGSESRTCSACSAKETNVLPKLGHTAGEWKVVKEATTAEEGLKELRCSVCGEVIDSEVIPKLEIAALEFSGVSLTLQDNLTINFKAKTALIKDNGYEKPYVIFKLNGEITKVTEYRIVGDSYVFDFTDIAPHNMGDTISAVLYATNDGVEYASATKEYSVTSYCYAVLERYTTAQYAKLRTLIVDLLNYGAESQKFMSHKVNALVNAPLTEEQKAMGTTTDRELVNVFNKEYVKVANATAFWKGAGLDLEESIGMRFKLAVDSLEGVTVKVTGEIPGQTIDSSKFKHLNDNVYYVYVENMNAGQMGNKVYLTAYKNGEAISDTICYSIESYAAQAQNTSYGNLVKAMIRYGDSAKAFAGK